MLRVPSAGVELSHRNVHIGGRIIGRAAFDRALPTILTSRRAWRRRFNGAPFAKHPIFSPPFYVGLSGLGCGPPFNLGLGNPSPDVAR